MANVDFAFSLKSQVADTEGMGGKLSADDKSTILSAVKETTEWLDENPTAEAEDYEDKLSELQSKVAVSLHLDCADLSPSLPNSTLAAEAATSRCHMAVTTSSKLISHYIIKSRRRGRGSLRSGAACNDVDDYLALVSPLSPFSFPSSFRGTVYPFGKNEECWPYKRVWDDPDLATLLCTYSSPTTRDSIDADELVISSKFSSDCSDAWHQLNTPRKR